MINKVSYLLCAECGAQFLNKIDFTLLSAMRSDNALDGYFKASCPQCGSTKMEVFFKIA